MMKMLGLLLVSMPIFWCQIVLQGVTNNLRKVGEEYTGSLYHSLKPHANLQLHPNSKVKKNQLFVYFFKDFFPFPLFIYLFI